VASACPPSTMFSVSRTPLPETGFDSLPWQKDNSIPITTHESRQSAMSISSDLFPELLSWSAFIDMTQRSHSASPLPQGMPNDIAEDDMFDDDLLTESECHQPLSLSRIFDPTTLAMGFDVSNFKGLDEQLIYSPQDAFLDLCWSCGECPYSSELEETVETISAPSLPSFSNPSTIESDSGLEECQTQFEDIGIRVQQFDGSPAIKILPYNVEKSPFTKDHVRDYSFNFDYQLNQNGSVGAFPIPIAKPSKRPRRFNVLRSQFKFGRS
jgi:hypothetical protein